MTQALDIRIPDNVIDANLPPLAGWLYVVIKRHVERPVDDKPLTLDRLAELANMSRASVARYIKLLVGKELLSVDPKAEGVKTEANQYHVAGEDVQSHTETMAVSQRDGGSITEILPERFEGETGSLTKTLPARTHEEYLSLNTLSGSQEKDKSTLGVNNGARARDQDPTPHHFEKGFGQPRNNQVLVAAIRRSGVYQAYVRGRGGIEPELPVTTADIAWAGCNAVQSDIDRGLYTLQDVEDLTRTKTREGKSFLLGYIRTDIAPFLERRKALKPEVPVYDSKQDRGHLDYMMAHARS